MTREEAIELLKEELQTSIDNKEDFADIDGIEKYNESLDMAIKALEHPERNVVAVVPCGDTISRDAVLEQTYLWSKDEFLRVTNPFDYLRKKINSLPSVNPQEPKTGHWIEHNAKSYECSVCHNTKSLYASYKTDYCPDCGARMENEAKE